MGFITVLKDEINPTELFELLKYLDVSAARLERFTTISLLITELRTKTSSLVMESVSADELLAAVLQRQDDQIQLRNMSVIVEGNPDTITFYGQRNLLEICFENLLDNALKYSPNGSNLTIGTESQVGQSIITFTDQGRSFTPETLTKIYQLLSRNDHQFGENEALDISLVNLIMDAHHGKMEVSNNDDAGTTIRLIFPDYKTTIKN